MQDGLNTYASYNSLFPFPYPSKDSLSTFVSLITSVDSKGVSLDIRLMAVNDEENKSRINSKVLVFSHGDCALANLKFA